MYTSPHWTWPARTWLGEPQKEEERKAPGLSCSGFHNTAKPWLLGSLPQTHFPCSFPLKKTKSCHLVQDWPSFTICSPLMPLYPWPPVKSQCLKVHLSFNRVWCTGTASNTSSFIYLPPTKWHLLQLYCQNQTTQANPVSNAHSDCMMQIPVYIHSANMPICLHFLRRHSWHFLLMYMSISQLPPFLHLYTAFFVMLLLKNPAQNSSDIDERKHSEAKSSRWSSPPSALKWRMFCQINNLCQCLDD